MTISLWTVSVNYNKGDIVYISNIFISKEYYICAQDHISDEVTYPSVEDIYWIQIDQNILQEIYNIYYEKSLSDYSDHLFNTSTNLPEPKSDFYNGNDNSNCISVTDNKLLRFNTNYVKCLIPNCNEIAYYGIYSSVYCYNHKDMSPGTYYMGPSQSSNITPTIDLIQLINNVTNEHNDTNNNTNNNNNTDNTNNNDKQSNNIMSPKSIITTLKIPRPKLKRGRVGSKPDSKNSDPNNLPSEPKIETKAEKSQNKLKRKLESIDQQLEEHKKKKNKLYHHSEFNVELSLKEKLTLLNVDDDTKIFILDKYDSSKKASDSEFSKATKWLKTVADIPFGVYKPFAIKSSDDINKITTFFTDIREKLDESIYGLDRVKEEILEFVARKIVNPNSKGKILALHGVAGTGKTKILHSLAAALNLPFYQINFGGLNDVAILSGHSETYVGSKPGKIVEVLSKSGCMNPIIYLDEIDKISDRKDTEINGLLTHLLDEEQNDKFQDQYLSNININLSKVFFVIAFNDIEKINPIVRDRLDIIHIESPSLQDKIIIAKEKLIPEILNTLNIKKTYTLNLSNELLEYLIYNKTKEEGVRELKKCLEKIFNKLNYYLLIEKMEDLSYKKIKKHTTVNITKTFIDNALQTQADNTSHLHMYI
jgi:ATP-dependent Lon protease